MKGTLTVSWARRAMVAAMAPLNPTDRTEEAPAVIPGWAWVALVLAVVVWWIVTFENSQLLSLVGAKAAASGNFFHELFHDGRHLLGVPCH
jgi:hypothetical protein